MGPVRDPLRQAVAEGAARLMACDGVADVDQARRKAARALGVQGARSLPDDAEVEAALQAWHALFAPQAHARRLDHLRRAAVELMQRLHDFQPCLAGALVSGALGSGSELRIHLYTDRVKELEFLLANEGLELTPRDQRLYCGQAVLRCPAYVLDTPEALMSVAVIDPRYRHQPLRLTPAAAPLERLSLPQLQALISSSSEASSV